ncbi:MAG: phospholipid carrier-dependent glycosyltransferase [Planctomycetota bacterium]
MREPTPLPSPPRRSPRPAHLPTKPVVVELDRDADPAPVRPATGAQSPASDSDNTSSSTAPPTVSRLPPRPRPALRRRATAALLLLILSLGALPLLTGLTQQPSDNPREIDALAIADETWRSSSAAGPEASTLERLVPMLGGQPILDQPPGQTWFTVLAFGPLDPAITTPATQLFRARLLSVIMSLITLGAVFWAGQSLGGLRTAVFASLVVLANPLLVIHGRLATPEMLTTGWTVLSVAAALWAIRPLRPSPKVLRQAAGWGLCGLALGLAALVRGPAVVPQVVLPLLLISMICPRRMSHIMGLAAAGAGAALMTIPWAIYVHQQDPHVWSDWLELLRPPTDLGVLAQAVAMRSGALLVGSGVWGVMVIAALIAPWTVRHPRARRAMLIGWVWAVSAIGLVMLGPVFGESGWSDMVAEVLLVVPVLALAVAQLLQRVGDVARAGGRSRAWPKVALITAGLVLTASLVGPVVLAQRSLGMATMHTAYWVGTGAVLVLLGVLAARWTVRPFPGRAVACWSAWTLAATTLVMIPASQGALRLPQAQQEIHDRPDVEVRRGHGAVSVSA